MESNARHAFSVAGGCAAPHIVSNLLFDFFLLNSFNLGSRPTQIILLSLKWRCYAFMKFIYLILLAVNSCCLSMCRDLPRLRFVVFIPLPHVRSCSSFSHSQLQPFSCSATATRYTQVYAEDLTKSEFVSFTQFVCSYCACYESGTGTFFRRAGLRNCIFPGVVGVRLHAREQ
jgi:hypothetical protein